LVSPIAEAILRITVKTIGQYGVMPIRHYGDADHGLMHVGAGFRI
jgi:hypothetical protein